MIKLTAVLMLAGFFELSARTYGQQITIDRKDASLEMVLEDIYNQTNYFYYAEAAVFAKAHPVTIKLRNASLEKVLDQCFFNQPLTYQIRNRVIVVTAKAHSDVDTLFDLRGRVINEKGQPMAGATVQVKSGKKLVMTDELGTFELFGVDSRTTIIVTSVGYRNEEVNIQGRRTLQVQLTLSVNNLDQVQVIGYGTTTKRLTTGSVSKVTAEEIERQPVNNPLAAISGRMAGVYIQQGTGVTNGNFNIKIRGTNSLRANGNNPLYIVDGVPFTSTTIASAFLIGSTQQGNPLSNINPSDVSSIEVLKDADATAIYGSRGANGVVLITTKKSVKGASVLDLSLSQGAMKAPQRLKFLNTTEYLTLRHEAFLNDGAEPNVLNDPDLLLWDTTRYTDWQKELIGGTANFTNAQFNYSGGNEHTDFVFGGGYGRESTVFPGDFFDSKISMHLNVNNSSLNNRLRTSMTVNFMSDKNKQIVQDLTSQLYLPPDAPAGYDSIGNLNWEKSTWNNPYSFIRQHYLNNTETFIFNGTAAYSIVDGLTIRLNAGYTSMYMSEKTLLPLSSLNSARGFTAESIFGNSYVKTVIAEPQIEYARTWKNHTFSALLGSTYHAEQRLGQNFLGSGYSSDALIESLTAAATVTPQENKQIDYKYAALFFRLNYNWKQKLLLNLTGRRDGSSRFGPGRKYASFGAIGLGWIFSEEPWVARTLKFLSFGKVRSSWGVVGNDQIADYGYLDLWYASYYRYDSRTAFVPGSLSNSDFAWEKTRKLEGSLDLGFFQNKLLLSISYYQNQSSNQLVGLPLPLITGFNSVQSNLPATVRNWGWEFEWQASIINSKKWQWRTSFNLTMPRNKLLSYPNIEASGYVNQYKVGEPVTTFKSFTFLGVNLQTGVFDFVDVNKDGMISFPQDASSYKDISQSMFGGIENSIRFGGLQLTLFIQGVKQTGRNYLSSYYPFGVSGVNPPTYFLERWTKPGQASNVQKATQDYSSAASTAYSNSKNYGSNTVTDASFFRLKNVYLSYDLPLKHTETQKMLFTFFVQGQNLLTITKYQGIDPETQSFSALPPLKVTTVGLKIKL